MRGKDEDIPLLSKARFDVWCQAIWLAGEDTGMVGRADTELWLRQESTRSFDAPGVVVASSSPARYPCLQAWATSLSCALLGELVLDDRPEDGVPGDEGLEVSPNSVFLNARSRSRLSGCSRTSPSFEPVMTASISGRTKEGAVHLM